jgi:hypothetical protein
LPEAFQQHINLACTYFASQADVYVFLDDPALFDDIFSACTHFSPRDTASGFLVDPALFVDIFFACTHFSSVG